MLNGCIPIQSDTSCGNEWIEHLESGFLVSILRPNEIIEAIRIAIQDDVFVDRAAKRNAVVAETQLKRVLQEDRLESLYLKN